MKLANICKSATLITLCAAALAFCVRPDWVKKDPQARKGAAYYYRVGSGEGSTKKAAKKEAYDDIVKKTANSLGTAKEIRRNPVTGEDAVFQEDAVVSSVPLSEVCEHFESRLTANGFTAYVLYQVAKDANVILEYRAFDCENSREMED